MELKKFSALSALFYSFLFIILTTAPGFGQLQENYFYDEEPKDRGYVGVSALNGNDIVFSGTTLMKPGSQVSVTKIDRQGNVLWVSAFPDLNAINKLISGSDGTVYAVGIVYNQSPQPYDSYILKIDPTTGTTIWKAHLVTVRPVYTFLDFDSNNLLIGFASAYDGMVYTQQIGLINKSTGAIVTHQIGKVSWQNEKFGVAFDTNKNLYYTLKDTVYRMSGDGSFTPHWKRYHSTSAINEIQRIHIDQNNKMFLLGSKNATFEKGIIIGIDPANGDMLSNVTTNTNDAEFSSLTENSTHLFVTWKPLGFGGYTGWWTTKVDKTTGAIAWNSSYNFNGTQLSTTLNTDQEAATDVKVDANGDVYLTGYFDGTSVQTGKWGVAKLNGNTGVPLYYNLINGNDPNAQQHKLSGGISTYLLDNYFRAIGNIQTFDNRSTPEYTTVDPTTGTIVNQTYFYGDYEYQSQILGIERTGNDIVILKQIGRSLQLGKYDSQNNLKWEKTITSEYRLTGGAVRLTPSGKIAVASLNSDLANADNNTNPLQGTVNVYVYEPDGTLSWNSRFDRLAGTGYETAATFSFIDLYADDTNLFVFFAKDNVLKVRKVTETTISSETTVDIKLHTNGALPYVFDDTGTTIRIAGIKTNLQARVIAFDKSTMNATVTDFVYPFSDISCIQKIDANEFLISGRDIKSNNFIARYNLTLQQTVWTRVLGNSASWTSKILRHSIEPTVVTIGTDNNYTSIRKIDFNNGSILGTYVNTTIGMKNIPADAAINETKGEIVFAGYYQSSDGTSTKNILMGSVKFSDLTPLYNIQTSGTFSGDNVATNVEATTDGTIWIGGNRNIDVLHKAAFIYTGSLAAPSTDTQPPLVTSAIPSGAINPIVKPTSPLVLNFNENILLGTGSVKIFNASSNSQLASFALTPSNTIISGTQVTITPNPSLPANVPLYVKLDAGTFKDLAGNIYQGSLAKDWSFSTDNVAPTLSSMSPAVGTFTKRDADLQLNFSEVITLGTGNIRIYNSTTASLIETIAIGSNNTTIQGALATVKHAVPFPANAALYAKIDAGTFQDRAGNNYAGLLNTTWYFNTYNIDSSNPALVNLIPNANSTASPNDLLQITLDEPISLGSGALRIFDATTDAPLGTITVTSSNTTIYNESGYGAFGNAYITQQIPLPAGKKIYVKVDAGVFTDLSGNAFQGIQDKGWTFTTTIPANQLVTFIPAANATNVSPYVALYLQFTESMIPNSGNAGMSIYDYDTDQLLAYFKVTTSNTVAWGSKVFVTPPDPLPSGKHVYVKVDNGAFRSISISPTTYFAGIQNKQWHFTTLVIADTQAPLITSKTPAAAAVNVSTGTALQLNFSENILLGTGSVSIFNASTDAVVSTLVLSASNTSITGSQATVTLPSQLAANTTFYVKVDNGTFKDQANNVFAGILDKSWSFTTGASLLAPTANTATAVTGNSFTANWTSVNGATGYQLDISLDNFATFLAGYNSASITGTSQLVTGLTAGTSYQYRIRAITSSSTSSNSSVISVTTLAASVSAPVATDASNISSTGFVANWNSVSGAIGYQLDISTDNFSTFLPGYNSKTVSGNSQVVSGLTLGVTYQYRLRAVMASATSANSNAIFVTTSLKASQTIIFQSIPDVTIGDPSIVLSATASSGLPVTFFSKITPAALIGNTFQLILPGRDTITASQSGNANYNAAKPVYRTFCINPAKPVITISNNNTTTPTLTSSASTGNQWYLNGVAIAGATSKTLSVASKGIYSLQVTVDDCVSKRSNDFPIIVTGEITSTSPIVLYPNPAADFIFISGTTELKSISAADLLGRSAIILTEHSVEAIKADIRNLSPGLYIVELVDSTGVHQIKFVKQ